MSTSSSLSALRRLARVASSSSSSSSSSPRSLVFFSRSLTGSTFSQKHNRVRSIDDTDVFDGQPPKWTRWNLNAFPARQQQRQERADRGKGQKREASTHRACLEGHSNFWTTTMMRDRVPTTCVFQHRPKIWGRIQRRENSGTTSATPTKEEATTTTTKQRQHQQEDHHRDHRVKRGVSSLDKNIVENVLNTRNVQNLRERLEEIKYTKEFITLERFGEVCRECGCTEKKPEEYVDVMKNAGLVIQIEDYVYLEPQNITRAVINALPGVPSRIYGVSDTELKKLNEEYDQMREKVVLAEKRAQRRANQLLYGGLIVLTAQLAMFIRFTYVEFSWDVMEPISYFVGLANVIMGYIYFMFTQRDFSFGTWQSQMMQNAMDRQLKTGKFDVEKYEQMARKLRRRYMVR